MDYTWLKYLKEMIEEAVADYKELVKNVNSKLAKDSSNPAIVADVISRIVIRNNEMQKCLTDFSSSVNEDDDHETLAHRADEVRDYIATAIKLNRADRYVLREFLF